MPHPDPPPAPVIEIENLTLAFENKEVLNSVSLRLLPGEFLVLMGKNGCGKSMLLKTIIGLFPPRRGFSKIFGEDIYELGILERDRLLEKMGYVFQRSGLFDSLNVLENVLFKIRHQADISLEEKIQRAKDSLVKTGLGNVLEKKPSELSGGMQKRAGIARAIVAEPELLIMDDPTAGLDPVLTDSIGNLILELKEELKCTALIVTHDLQLAYKLANKIGLIIDGRIHGILNVEDFRNTSEPYFYQFRESKLEGPISTL